MRREYIYEGFHDDIRKITGDAYAALMSVLGVDWIISEGKNTEEIDKGILAYVLYNPGKRFNDILRNVGIDLATLKWRLKKLIEAKRVTKIRSQYFYGNVKKRFAHIVKNQPQIQEEIVEYVKKHPGAKMMEIGNTIGQVTDAQVQYALGSLVKKKILSKSSRKYYLNAIGQ